MSDSGDDWLANADSDDEQEQKKEQETKKKFDDEDQVDSEAIKKQKEEEAKKLQKEKEKVAQAENAILQEQNKKKNYEDLWQQRQKDIPNEVKIDTKGKTNEQIAYAAQVASESNKVAQLFEGDDDDKKEVVKVWQLNSEKDYKEFGKHTGSILYKGSTPYRVENFFRELCRELPEHCDSTQIGNIVDYMKSVFNQKQKAEKEERDGKNKKKKKAALQGGGAKGYDRNGGQALVNDVLGGIDDDYGDYGNEQGFTREGENDYDFM